MTVLTIPEWTVGDRLAKARQSARVSRDEMAQLLGVHRNTVSNYERGTTAPSVAVLRVWAQRCEVPFEWLRSGEVGLDEVAMTQSKWTARSRSVVPDRSQLAFWPRRVA